MHPWDTTRQLPGLHAEAVAKARDVGAEVVVVCPSMTPSRSATRHRLARRRYAVQNNVACADARTYLLGPGEIYWGGYFANPIHPGPEGHRLMGQVLAEMFR